MKKKYRDFYGGTASITKVKDGFRLKICTPHGVCHTDKVYKTERGARNVMGRSSDCWKEQDKK